jgi:hypothetical protein
MTNPITIQTQLPKPLPAALELADGWSGLAPGLAAVRFLSGFMCGAAGT